MTIAPAPDVRGAKVRTAPFEALLAVTELCSLLNTVNRTATLGGARVVERTRRSLSNISIFELRRRIASLKTADLKHLTDEAAAYRIGHVIDQYPFQLKILQLTGIYRARPNKPGEVFSSTKQLWYPPADAVTQPAG